MDSTRSGKKTPPQSQSLSPTRRSTRLNVNAMSSTEPALAKDSGQTLPAKPRTPEKSKKAEPEEKLAEIRKNITTEASKIVAHKPRSSGVEEGSSEEPRAKDNASPDKTTTLDKSPTTTTASGSSPTSTGNETPTTTTSPVIMTVPGPHVMSSLRNEVNLRPKSHEPVRRPGILSSTTTMPTTPRPQIVGISTGQRLVMVSPNTFVNQRFELKSTAPNVRYLVPVSSARFGTNEVRPSFQIRVATPTISQQPRQPAVPSNSNIRYLMPVTSAAVGTSTATNLTCRPVVPSPSQIPETVTLHSPDLSDTEIQELPSSSPCSDEVTAEASTSLSPTRPAFTTTNVTSTPSSLPSASTSTLGRPIDGMQVCAICKNTINPTGLYNKYKYYDYGIYSENDRSYIITEAKIKEAYKLFFGYNDNELQQMKGNTIMCTICQKSLVTSYEAFTSLRNRMSKDSTIGKHLFNIDYLQSPFQVKIPQQVRNAAAAANRKRVIFPSQSHSRSEPAAKKQAKKPVAAPAKSKPSSNKSVATDSSGQTISNAGSSVNQPSTSTLAACPPDLPLTEVVEEPEEDEELLDLDGNVTEPMIRVVDNQNRSEQPKPVIKLANNKSPSTSTTNSKLYSGFCFSFLNLNVSRRLIRYKQFQVTNPAVNTDPPTNTKKTTHAVSLMGIFNRIPQLKNELFQQFTPPKAIELNPSAFLMTQDDFNIIKNDHKFVIQKILVETMSIFDGIEAQRVKHKYFEESSKLSKTINLGLLGDEEDTPKGLKKILQHLSVYLPKGKSGEAHPLVAFGDGFVTDRTAVLSKIEGTGVEALKKSIISGPAIWTKRSLLLKDDVTIFSPYRRKEKLSGEHAVVLDEIKEKYFPDGNKKQFGLRPNLYMTAKLMTFTLHSYLTALAVKILLEENAVPDRAQTPNEIVEQLQYLDKRDKEIILDGLTDRILEYEWHDHLEESMLKGQLARSCICKVPDKIDADFASDLEKPGIPNWIICANIKCKSRFWYHKDCLDDYIEQCKKEKRPCNLISPFKKVMKLKAKQVLRSGKTKPREYIEQKVSIATTKWYCTQECFESTDLIVDYSKAIIFGFLNHEVYRNAIRENDGEKMNIYNKLHLVHLYNRSLGTSFRIWHRLIAMINGLAPNHIKHDLLWNSTVNIKGLPATNLEVDFYHEFVNRVWKKYFSYDLGTVPGREYLQRRSQLYDIETKIKEELKVFDLQEFTPLINSEEYDQWMSNLNDCVQSLLHTGVFTPATTGSSSTGDMVVNRSHPGLESFKYDALYINDLTKYKEFIRQHCEAIDNNVIFTMGDDDNEGPEGEEGGNSNSGGIEVVDLEDD